MSPLFDRRRWVLETTLTREECVSRLKPKLRGMWETRWNPDKPLYGKVTSSGFAVQLTTDMGRTFNPFFVRGRFSPNAAGTTIRARYGVLTTYRLFVIGMASLFPLMWWRVSRVSHGMPLELHLFLGIVWLFLVLIAYWGAGPMIRMAEFDRDLVLRAVAEILEARISEAT